MNPLESSGPTSEAMNAFFEGSLTSVTMQDIDTATITLDHSPDRVSYERKVVHDNRPSNIFKQQSSMNRLSTTSATRQADLEKYVDIQINKRLPDNYVNEMAAHCKESD